MVYPEFQPAQSPATQGASLLSGFNAGQSFFEQQYRRRLDAERAALVESQNQILMPALAAKARADVAQAGAELDGLRQTEDARRQAFELLPQARAEFDRLMSNTDAAARAEAALDWASKYSHFENLGPLAAEFKSKSALAARLVQDGTALSRLRETLASRERIATIGANSRELTGLPAFEKLRRLRDQAAEDGDTEGAQELDVMLSKMQRTPTPATDASRIKTLLSEADDAEAAGDTALATALRSRVKRLTEPKQTDDAALRSEVLGLLGGQAAAPTTTTSAPKSVAPAQSIDGALNNLKF